MGAEMANLERQKASAINGGKTLSKVASMTHSHQQIWHRTRRNFQKRIDSLWAQSQQAALSPGRSL